MAKRIDIPGAARYLTFSCYKRKWLFNDPNICTAFIEHLAKTREKHRFALWAYVIMPSHVHLLLRPADGIQIGTILHSLKRTFSFHSVKYLRQNHPEISQQLIALTKYDKREYRFWQHGSGYDRVIVNELALKKAIDYIHNNPVRAGLATTPTDWQWSSARFWIDGDTSQMKMDKIELL